MNIAHDTRPTAIADNPFADDDTRRPDAANPFADEQEHGGDTRRAGKRRTLGFGAVTEVLKRMSQRREQEGAAVVSPEENPFADSAEARPAGDNPFADGTPEEEERRAYLAEQDRTDNAQEAARQTFRRESERLQASMETIRKALEDEVARSLAEKAGIADEDRVEVAELLKQQPLDTGRLVQILPGVRETAMMYHDLYARLRDATETRRAAVPGETPDTWQ